MGLISYVNPGCYRFLISFILLLSVDYFGLALAWPLGVFKCLVCDLKIFDKRLLARGSRLRWFLFNYSLKFLSDKYLCLTLYSMLL